MKNKQGFLSNKLNKYAIRKFTVGTASLLIGATLVFGVGSEAKADELDKISSKDSTSNSDKGEALDVEDIKPVDDSQQTAKQEESTATSETVDTDATTQDTAQQSKENTKENNKEDINATSQDSEDTTQAQDNAKEQTSSNDSDDKEQSDQKANTKNTTETDTTQDENTPSSEQQKDSTPEKETTTNDTHTDNTNETDTKEDTKANTNNDENKNESEKSNTTSDSNDKASTTEDNKKTTTTNTSDSLVKTIESNDVTDNKVDTKSNTSKIEDTTQENKSESVDESQLTKRLAASTDKETEVKDFLTDQLSAKDADAIMENADVDYSKDSVEDINLEILKASLIQLANKQKAAEPLATAPRTMLRAMATPTAFRAAVTQSEKVEKSLGYLDNYTFASLIFAPGTLTGSTLDGNVIPFDIHSYMSGSNSGSRYKIDLKLDPLIADHVTKISVNPAGRSTPVVFTRLNDDDGNPSNIWEINFIRANGGLFGGAEILSQYSATNGKIELDDTLSNILKDAGDLSNNKLNYQIYVRDSEGNKIVKTSESSGYFLSSADSDLIQYENNISPENKSDFKASSGTAVYDDAPGDYGGFIIDQQIMKNGIFTYSKTKNKQWSYNYQIDKDLLPYIDSVELDTYDYQGLGGFDKTYNASNKVADLQIDSNGNGKITSDNLNKLIEFNNLTPETVGIRIVVKLNQSVNNILTKNAEYDSNGNLIRETTKQKEDFTFAGFLTDSNNLLINNTLGTSTLALQDYDKDGLLDRYERQVSLSDPENEDTDGDGKNDGDEIINYKTSPLVGIPNAADITTDDAVVTGSVPLKDGAATQTAKVINSNGDVIGTSTVNADGTFSVTIPKSSEGTYTIAIDSPNYDNDEVNTFEIIDVSKVPTPTINPVDDNDTEVVVNGTANATITVKDQDDNVIGTVTIPADGSSASIKLDQPLKAGTVLTSTASKNGKTSDVSDQVIVTDDTAPEAPTVNDVTSDDTTISGKAEPGSTVKVTFPDGTTAEGTTDEDGNYTIDIPSNVDLQGGEELPVTATDKDGNESEPATTTVTDTTAPEAPTVNDVTSDDTTISGKAEPGSTVTVTFPDGTTATGTTDEDGNYTIDIPSNVDLKGGEELPVTATDKDDNTSEPATATVTDTTAPEAPTVNDITSDDTTISGKAEPGSTVKVTFPDGTTAEGTTDADGNYTIDIPSNVDLKGGEELPVTATDKDGNESEQATATVIDTTAPETPTVNDITSDDTTISGKAEPGSTVKVTFPDGTTAEGTADEDGNYTIDIPSNVDLRGGEELPVTATDKDGNESEPATATVTDTTAPTVPTVNPITSDDTTISGKAEPGSTVTVTFPDGTTATGTTDEDGNYTIDIPSNVDLKGGEELPITATDKDGNESEPTTATVTDTTAPTVPTVNPITSDDKTISGKAEPGSTVTVTFPDGTTAEGTTDADGNYTIDIPSNVDLQGGEELPVTATDKDGNESEPATATVTDTTAPEAPMVNDVTSDDTTISGKAEPGSTVTVTFPDGTTATGTTDADGNYTIDIPSNVDLQGGEELPITATDSDGNESDPTTVTVTDTTAPTVPTVNPITSDDTTINGTAEPGSTVTVTFPDGTTAEGTADEEGNYTIDIPSNVDLKGGEELPVTATDKDGNTSEPATVTVTDTTAPEAPTVNDITSDDTTISGKAEPGSTVKVTFPDGTTAEGTADEDGNYTIDIPSNVDLQGGEELPVTATDKDGNTSEPATATVTDTTAPEAPTVNDVTSDDTTISGKAEPGSTVKVTFPDGTTATGTTDEDGNYTIDIPSNVDLQGGEELPVTATDKDGNESEPATATVTDTTAPEAPTVNDVTSDDTTISGKAEPGSTVTVTFPDGTTATGTTDADGNYTIEIPSNVDLQGGEELPVTATDKDGNTSDPATATVTDTTAPEAPTVNDVTSDDTTISGKAEPGSTVKVTFPDGTTAEGTADEEGNYTIDIPSNVDLKGGEELPVTSTDKDGNTSEPATATVTDTTAPETPTVNDVTSDDTTISGKAEPGSTVKVTFPDGTTAEGTADEEGNYTIDIPSNVDLQGGEELPVTATDKDGNESDPATVTVTDTTAPETPTVNDVTSDDTTISGKAEPGSTVTVTFPDGTTATGTANEDGNYTIDIPSNVDLKGGEELPVTATDKDGNESEQATATVTDTTAPTVPTVNPITSDDTTISGKAEPGSTVKVTFPDGTTAEGTTDADGNYTIDIPSNVDLKGGEELPITATDKDGNESDPATATVTDTTAPEAPTVNDVTSDDTTISGKAEPGSTVKVTFPDGTTAEGTTDADGNYTIDIPSNVDLQGGEELPVTATDKDGNTSEPATATVTDTTAPEAPTVNDVTSDDTTISGKAEPGSTVTVTFPDGTTAEGTADADGNYTIDIPTNVDLKGGEELPVTSTDKDGNKSDPATVTVTDTTAPTVPTVNPITSDDTTISGKAEPGSTVTVTFPDGTTAEGTTDKDGNYTIEIPSNVDLKGGEELPVTATDKDGNESEPTTVTVTDTTAPEAPTVNPITSDDTTISGKAEPGSTVTVTFPDGTTATGTTDGDGNYTIEIPDNVHLQPGDTVIVTATDKDGNTSNQTNINVQLGNENTNHGDNTDNNKDGPDTTHHNNGDNGNDGNDIDSGYNNGDNDGNQIDPVDNNGTNSSNNSPVINPIDSRHQVISGQHSTPGSTVEVTFPNGITTTTTVNPNGTWEMFKPSSVNLNDGESVSVVEKDSNGNTTYTTTANVGNKNTQQKINNGDNTTEEDLPETGETSTNNATIFGSLFAAIGALLLFVKRRRKKEEKED